MVTKLVRARAYSRVKRVTGHSREVIFNCFSFAAARKTVGLGTIDGHSITGFLQVKLDPFFYSQSYIYMAVTRSY